MATQKASRDVVDLVSRPITQGIDVDGDGSSNFRIDGTGIGLSSPADARFTEITMSGRIDMAGERINNVPTPLAGTDAVNRDYVTSQDSLVLVAANAYTDSQVGGVSLLPAGSVIPYAGTSLPAGGWLWCNGAAYDQATYSALYAAVGTTYNTGGEGVGEFRVPDLLGRTIAGKNDMGGVPPNRLQNPLLHGISAGVLGSGGGAEGHALAVSEQGNHTHSGTTDTTPSHVDPGGGSPVGNVCASNNHVHNFTTGTPSGGAPGAEHNNVQPTLILNYIIKT